MMGSIDAIVAILGEAIVALARNDRRNAARHVRDALELMEGVCASCGRSWGHEE